MSSETQTTLHQFYKVVYKSNTGNGAPLEKLIKQKNSSNKHIIRSKKSENILSSPVVKSEVDIIFDKRKMSQKRSSSSPLSSNEMNMPKRRNISTGESPSQYESPKTPPKQRTPHKSPKRNGFSPKTPVSKRNIFKTSVDLSKVSPKRLFSNDIINFANLRSALENLHLVKQGSIQLNNLDLHTIYEIGDFEFIYENPDNMKHEKISLSQINFPKEINADHMMMIIADVFSNPLNCGYFNKEELEFIFSLLQLSAEAQQLFVRLFKRKLGWHRTSNIKYKEISDNLEPFFDELITNEFCVSDTKNMELTDLLDLLHLNNIRNVCKKLKIPNSGSKADLISKLTKNRNSKVSVFVGAKSPNQVLRDTVVQVLQKCVCLPQQVISIFDRVLTLLNPVQDPSESITVFFLMLTNVNKGELIYPYHMDKIFPIFKDRQHLIDFAESKNALKDILDAIERKDWDKVRNIGYLALAKLDTHQKQKNSSLPSHVRKFDPHYTWRKVLYKSIDSFKKTKEGIDEAIKILNILIDDCNYSQSSKGRFYKELALIEMHHKKNLERSAELILNFLSNDENLSTVDITDSIERLEKLLRRKTGISEETKYRLVDAQTNIKIKYYIPESVNTKTISASIADRVKVSGKNTWEIIVNGNDKSYGSVEMLALHHYTTEEDFQKGLHCEGLLPVTLFTILFWEELYKVFVPSVFVTQYQDAPLDLFTADFCENRKRQIKEKLEFFENIDLLTFSQWMADQYSQVYQYKSLITSVLFTDEKQLEQLVICIGKKGVLGICQKLLSNFYLWRSGFPDLILWNASKSTCKIVEVKGPGDSLSVKQKLWLQYLDSLEIKTEVCHVVASSRSSK